ncbi:hypothetical protein M426DRAFT_323197 [Hypoxylon sp. CI-4A]|nr:hypothetical protein M426DRAFT_323197 [Hypoxylon sp. CI-4A]
MSESSETMAADSPMPPQAPLSPPLSTSSPTSAYVKPQPRPPRSPAHSALIRVQNRRREYLERNPKYFDSHEHELADPLLYDALIRRFQTPEEREKEGREKGYSRVLEVDLLRGEAKLAQMACAAAPFSTCQTPFADSAAAAATASQNLAPQASSSSSSSSSSAGEAWLPQPASEDTDAFIREYAIGGDGFGDDATSTSISTPNSAFNGSGNENSNGNGGVNELSNKNIPRKPETREEGRERWDDFLRRRFVLGRDDDFDYRTVDENDDLDALERREQEDAWFDDEDPDWASDSAEDQGGGARLERMLEGETGIQDF